MQGDGDRTTIFYSAKKCRERYRVSAGTLRLWETQGRVNCVRTPGGKRLYEWASVEALLGKKAERTRKERHRVIYARVSSQHQQQDLERQKNTLQEARPGCIIYTDIASGINFKRPGLQALLDAVMRGDVQEVVVAH